MKKTLLSLSFVAAGVVANAGLDMDHINQIGTNLGSTANFGVMQIFPDFMPFSGTVVDDFRASGNVVSNVSVAFELSNSSVNTNLIQGWRVSIFSSPGAAAASGDNLIGDVASVLAAPPAITTLNGTSAAGPARMVSINTNLAVSTGTVYWVGAAPVLEFAASGGQTFILSHTAPALLGNGTSNDSVGVNPSNGFGLGSQIAVNTNAAYSVTTVPEPATMIALGAGLAAFARRRRSSK